MPLVDAFGILSAVVGPPKILLAFLRDPVRARSGPGARPAVRGQRPRPDLRHPRTGHRHYANPAAIAVLGIALRWVKPTYAWLMVRILGVLLAALGVDLIVDGLEALHVLGT